MLQAITTKTVTRIRNLRVSVACAGAERYYGAEAVPFLNINGLQGDRRLKNSERAPLVRQRDE